MTGINFTETGTTYVAKTKDSKGKEVTLTLNDADGDGIDNHDGIKVTGGDISVFGTPTEIKTAILGLGYRSTNLDYYKTDEQGKQIKFPEIAFDKDSKQIDIKQGTEYSIGSLLNAIQPKPATNNTTTNTTTSVSSSWSMPSLPSFGFGGVGGGGNFNFDSASTLNPNSMGLMTNVLGFASGLLGLFESTAVSGNIFTTLASAWAHKDVSFRMADSVSSTLLNNWKNIDLTESVVGAQSNTNNNTNVTENNNTNVTENNNTNVTENNNTNPNSNVNSEVTFKGHDENTNPPAEKVFDKTAIPPGQRGYKIVDQYTTDAGTIFTCFANGNYTMKYKDGHYEVCYFGTGNRTLDVYNGDDNKLVKQKQYVYESKDGKDVKLISFQKFDQTEPTAATPAPAAANVTAENDVDKRIAELNKQLKKQQAICNEHNSNTIIQDNKKLDEIKTKIKNLNLLKTSPELKEQKATLKKFEAEYDKNPTRWNAARIRNQNVTIKTTEYNLETYGEVNPGLNW